jgi:hypothetical protein
VAIRVEPGLILKGHTREVWKQALKNRYEKDKMSIRQLVAWSGRSYGGVHSLLLEAGVKLRKRGGHKKVRN